MGLLDGTGMEKRRYIRVSSHFPIKYYSVEDTDAARAPYEAMSDNISIGGIMFFAETQYRINETLRLEFKLGTIELSIFGRIAWLDEIEAGKIYNTGVEFQNLSQQQKDDLGTFVNSMIKDRQMRS